MLKIDDFIVPPEKPFDNNLLNRQTKIKALTDLVENIDIPFVISIDAKWGAGKTVFIEMWKQYANNKGFTSIYYNAWENDFMEDPLTSFIGEISSVIENLKTDDDEKNKKLKNIIKSFSREAAPIILQGLLSKVITNEAGEKLATLTSEKVAEITRKKIDNYFVTKKSIGSFKKTLLSFIEEMNNIGKKTPLLFFVDELDRCRPTFAIELLEKIKHLFNITGIVFVLALEKEQLIYSIKAFYGSGFDAAGYLNRFFNYSLNLTETNLSRLIGEIISDSNLTLMATQRVLNYDEIEALRTYLEQISNNLELPPRTIRQCMGTLEIAARFIKEQFTFSIDITMVLIIIRFLNRKLYLDFINRKKSSIDIINFIQPNLRKRIDPILIGRLLSFSFWEKREKINQWILENYLDESGKGAFSNDERIVNDILEKELNLDDGRSIRKKEESFNFIIKRIESSVSLA